MDDLEVDSGVESGAISGSTSGLRTRNAGTQSVDGKCAVHEDSRTGEGGARKESRLAKQRLSETVRMSTKHTL